MVRAGAVALLPAAAIGARGCRLGVARLPDGRLAFSTGREIRTVAAS